ncbi:MAG: helicase-related protein [Bacteroidota bacterium]
MPLLRPRGRAKNICPNCGHEELRQLGYGTQRIEEELAGRLKDIGIDANIERMDLDTTSRKGAHRRLLQDFAAGRTDILVGTQMVAKGLDFERVTLVGIINSDIQLFVPDFRSSERTFQLLTQVSGRAGRVSGFPGEVIIQSSKASNFAIKAAQNSNYDIFYNRELNIRKSAGYPPFIRFVMIEFYGKSREETAKHAVYFLKYMPRNQNVFTLLGPTEPTIPRIRNLYRKIIIIKVNKELDPGGYILRKILSRSVQQYRETHGSTSVRLVVDIDSYRTV